MNQQPHPQATRPPDSLPWTDLILQLADTALVLGQRNAEWCGHGPVLEQDIAITNISLDLVGQARLLYQLAADRLGGGATEDSLAYLRTEREYRNLLLVEQPRGDWGQTVLRQFLFTQFQHLQYELLLSCPLDQLAAIAAKSRKETAYHLRWSGEWVIRLGDGTEESHRRMRHALGELWRFTGELFAASPCELACGMDPAGLQPVWLDQVTAVLREATLPVPAPGETFMQTGGKLGRHSEHLGYLLAEMQVLQRTYPGATW
ncbi:MAG TPA: 1,2-phenylacetyl-CoA epoxidase subunit PaaC [Chitinophagaceae bacterium]|nr:1,2-phenylacetyl-CoA epoxidase subunit PaaC [Chitinophagaceae bacterium]